MGAAISVFTARKMEFNGDGILAQGLRAQPGVEEDPGIPKPPDSRKRQHPSHSVLYSRLEMGTCVGIQAWGS